MKRGMIGRLLFVSILLVFLCSGVFALAYGTCDITTRANCPFAGGNRIVMGLSSQTSAHGEFPDTGVYPYVLCCALGTGSTACTGLNKVLGISNPTNAHAEIPSLTNYLTNVCYEDFDCMSTPSNCGTNDALNYKLNLTSLSGNTNAHIGRISDYPVKICCKSSRTFAPCELQSASWSVANAIEGQIVSLRVVGSGAADCDDKTLTFQLLGGFEPVKKNATNVAFNGNIATGVWAAEWQDGGWLRGNPQFYFNASMVRDPTKAIVSSNPKLTVAKREPGYCDTKTVCGDYPNLGECDTDFCDVAKDSSLPGIDCSAPLIFCSCMWNSSVNECEFGYTEIIPDPCDPGTTLCTNPITGVNYCHPGNECPPGTDPDCNSNGICEFGEGCTCADCDGQQDSCVLGAICVNEKCNSTIPPKNVTCKYGTTLCQDSVSGMDFCCPGSSCAACSGGVTCNNNGDCEFGEGCTCADCKDGDQDTCSDELYCVSGECGSVKGPVDIGSCRIKQTILKNCDEDPPGYKTISWTGTWTGNETSGKAYTDCITGGKGNVPCPAQVQLPFFSYYGVAITLGVITLIYFFLISKKKLKRKKK